MVGTTFNDVIVKNQLLSSLEKICAAKQSSQKVTYMLSLLKSLEDKDINAVVHLLLYPSEYRIIEESQLIKWFESEKSIDKNTLSDCLEITNNYLETISLLKSNNQSTISFSILSILSKIAKADRNDIDSIRSLYNEIGEEYDATDTFLILQIITGQIGKGINSKIITRAVSILYSFPDEWVHQRLSNSWDWEKIHFEDLLKGKNALSLHIQNTDTIQIEYTYHHSYLSNFDCWNLTERTLAHLIIKGNKFFIQYFNKQIQTIDYKINKEIKNTIFLISIHTKMGFHISKSFIHEEQFDTSILEGIELLDIIHSEDMDLKLLPYAERKKLLKAFTDKNLLRLPQATNEEGFKQILIPHAHLLREKYFLQHSGQNTLHAVLTHATLGMGRRETFYTDYTFSILHQGQLKGCIKIKSSDAKDFIKDINAFIQKNTLQKFGNLVGIRPEMIFEISFSHLDKTKSTSTSLTFRNPTLKTFLPTLTLDYISKSSDFENISTFIA